MSISDLISLVSSSSSFLSDGLDWQQNLLDRGILFAYVFENVDIMGNIQTAWNDFLHTGKAGAMAVGLVMGYVIRGITR
jgi:hypothetical protein